MGPQRVSTHCGVVTWPMSFVTSPLRLLTSPSRTALRQSSPPPRTPLPNVNSPPTLLLVELLELCPFSSYTPWTTPEPGSPMTTSPRLEPTFSVEWLVLVSWLVLRSSRTSTSSGGPARSLHLKIYQFSLLTSRYEYGYPVLGPDPVGSTTSIVIRKIVVFSCNKPEKDQ